MLDHIWKIKLLIVGWITFYEIIGIMQYDLLPGVGQILSFLRINLNEERKTKMLAG